MAANYLHGVETIEIEPAHVRLRRLNLRLLV